ASTLKSGSVSGWSNSSKASRRRVPDAPSSSTTLITISSRLGVTGWSVNIYRLRRPQIRAGKVRDVVELQRSAALRVNVRRVRGNQVQYAVAMCKPEPRIAEPTDVQHCHGLVGANCHR